MNPIFSQGFTMPAPMTPPAAGGGMFGGNRWKDAIAAALMSFAAGNGNQNATAMMQQLMMQRREKQQADADQAQYSQRRSDQMSDWMTQYNYKLANPEPDDFTQMMLNSGVDPNSEQGRGFYLQALQNKANPFQAVTIQNPDGSERREFMRPPMAPTAPVGNLRPLGAGGAGGQPPRGFLGF